MVHVHAMTMLRAAFIGGLATALWGFAAGAWAAEERMQKGWQWNQATEQFEPVQAIVNPSGQVLDMSRVEAPSEPGTQCSGTWSPGSWGCYRGVTLGPNCEQPFGPVPANWHPPVSCPRTDLVDYDPPATPPPGPAPRRAIEPIVDPQAPAEYQCGEDVQVNAPNHLRPDEDYWVEVTLKNTGSAMWHKPSAGGYNGVYIQIPSDVRQTVDWGYHWNEWHVDNRQIKIPHDVAPGESVTVRLPIRGPAEGTYTFQTQLYINHLAPLMDDRPYGAFCRSEAKTITVGTPEGVPHACQPGDFLLDRNSIVRGRGDSRFYGGTARYITKGETQTFCAVVDQDITGQGLGFYSGPGFYMWDDQGTQREVTIIPPANSGLQIIHEGGNSTSPNYQAAVNLMGQSVPVPNPPQGRYRIIVKQIGDMMTPQQVHEWILSLPPELREQYRGYQPGGYAIGWMGPNGNWAGP